MTACGISFLFVVVLIRSRASGLVHSVYPFAMLAANQTQTPRMNHCKLGA